MESRGPRRRRGNGEDQHALTQRVLVLAGYGLRLTLLQNKSPIQFNLNL
jgi:hypothetical protein